MAARQNYYSEEDGSETNSTGTYAAKHSLTFTPDASSDYLIIASSRINGDSVVGGCQMRLQNTTSATTLSESVWATQGDATDIMNDFMLDVETFGASPSSQTYEVQFRNESGGIATASDTKICALKLHADDEFVSDDAETTTTSTSFVVASTLTFTPESTGDYLIIATAEIDLSVTNNQIEVKLVHSATDYGFMSHRAQDVNNWNPWATIVRLNLTNSSKTFEIQFRAGAGTAGVRNRRIVAIRLDTLDNNYYGESRAESDTTSSTYQDKATLTATPVAVNHLLIACSIGAGSSSTADYGHKFIEGSTTLGGEVEREAYQNNAAFDFMSNGWVVRRSLAASSTTWKTQFRSVGGTATSRISESAIAILQLDATPAGGAPVPMLMLMGVGI